MKFNLITVAAALVSVAAAWTTPVGEPKGNPITEPGAQTIVKAGEPFEIKWNPTTTGTVTLLLLRGPSTNVVPLYAIVEKTPNSGSYKWTPSTSLEDDVTHYGIQLIDDATGQYQYTTQFGVSNKNPKPEESKPEESKPEESKPSAPPVASDYPVSSGMPTVTYSTRYETVTHCPCTAGSSGLPPYPGTNTTVPTYGVPSVTPVATNTPPPIDEYHGNSASSMKVGGTVFAVAAAVAFALF
jgi:hypothetical protein